MSGFLAGAGVIAAAGGAAAAILLPRGRLRSAALILAIALVPILILGDQWHSHRIADLREHPARIAILTIAGLAGVAILAALFRRWPVALPLAIVAVLPVRLPLEAGGETANLLVPLYLVIGAGVLVAAIRDRGGAEGGAVAVSALAVEDPRALADPPARSGAALRWLPRILAAVVMLYALQVLYSADFSKGLQDVCFFYAPFAALYVLLSDFSWDRRLLRAVLWVVAVEAVLFVLVGSIEYESRSLFWNNQVIRSNEFHTYFRVNSVFWDPNIYGRYLALAIVVAMAVLAWVRERRSIVALCALLGVLWIGLAPTFSQSSFLALLAGLAVLGALRWSLGWTLAAVAAAGLAAIVFVALLGGSSKIGFSRLNPDTSGRAHLVSGGLRLFEQRPLYGYGSGSFSTAYRDHAAKHRAHLSVSHTEPITVAAEQGVIGSALYLALLVSALWTMASGMRAAMPGLRRPSSAGAIKLAARGRGAAEGDGKARPRGGPASPAWYLAARAAVLAAFVALLIHTMAYAGFYEDPISWVLLAVGASLAATPPGPPRNVGSASCRATSAA